jgi:nucleotide-binding universal stress UspA family protein
MKTLVVPVDETELSERALPVAAALARATGAEVLLVMVDSVHIEPGEDLAYLDEELKRLPPKIARRRLLDLVDQDVDEAIVEVAAGEPDAVIVMATHARVGAAALLLGSVADGVMRRTALPVVLVGPRCATAEAGFGGAVAVAVDGSSRDEQVLDVACNWAATTGSRLLVVHSRVPVAVEGGPVLVAGDELAERLAARARASRVDAAARTVDAASAAGGVLDVAAEVDASVVVVGTRRPGRLGRALLGSTADTIARHASCPVVVVGGPLDSTP